MRLSQKDSSLNGMNSENGPPQPVTEAPSGSDQGLDSPLPLHVSEEGGAEESTPVGIVAEPFITDGIAPSLPDSAAPGEFPAFEPPLFAHYEYVPPPPPRRKPDFADCLLFALLAIAAFFCSGVLMMAALHYHLFGVSTLRQANEEIHYRIGSQAAWYILTLLLSVLIFPFAWRRKFLRRAAMARRGRRGTHLAAHRSRIRLLCRRHRG